MAKGKPKSKYAAKAAARMPMMKESEMEKKHASKKHEMREKGRKH